MSVFRMTGQRPDSGAASVTVAASAAAASTVRSKRSTSWRRKLPVPCEQRRVLAEHLDAAVAQLEHREAVAADGDDGGRCAAVQEAVARGLGLLGRHAQEDTWRPRRPVTAAPSTLGQPQSWRSARSAGPGALCSSAVARRAQRSAPRSPISSTSLIVSAPTSIPMYRAMSAQKSTTWCTSAFSRDRMRLPCFDCILRYHMVAVVLPHGRSTHRARYFVEAEFVEIVRSLLYWIDLTGSASGANGRSRASRCPCSSFVCEDTATVRAQQ